MMIRIVPITAMLLASPGAAAPVFLQLKAALDTPAHFCIDLKGYDADVDLNAPVQVHSCKVGFSHTDQDVDAIEARNGRLRLPTYDRCLASVGTEIMPQPCTDAANQTWSWAKGGTLHAADGRCLTAGAVSRVAGSPKGVDWLSRNLSLEVCSPAAAPRQQWRLRKARVQVE